MDSEYEFKNRYKVPFKVTATDSTIQDARNNYFDLVNRNIKRLQAVENRAKSMKYFDQLMSRPDLRAKEIHDFKANGGKVIGVFCVQIPEELIYAAGCIPIRLSCGFYDAIPVAEEFMPANCCPMARSSMGFPFLKITPFFEQCDVVIIPTTCDAKKKMADVMSNYKEVWTLQLPQNRDTLDAREKWQSEMEKVKYNLEKLTGKKIKRKSLEKSTKLLIERTRVAREFLDIKKSNNIVINGRDSLLAMQTAFTDDIDRWIRGLQVLTQELQKNIREGKTIANKSASRIMITGSPLMWPTWKVLDSIEDQNAVVIIDDSCAGTQYFYNPVESPDWSMKGMMTAISDKYLLPTVCPIFVHSDDRVDRILELSEQYGIHGIVYHVLRLCTLMDFEHNKVRDVLRQKKMPMLRIETEYGEEDIGQIKTRVEAFVEMIKARRE